VPPRSPWVGVTLVGSGDGVGGPQAQKKGEGGLISAGKLSMTGGPFGYCGGGTPTPQKRRIGTPPPQRSVGGGVSPPKRSKRKMCSLT